MLRKRNDANPNPHLDPQTASMMNMMNNMNILWVAGATILSQSMHKSCAALSLPGNAIGKQLTRSRFFYSSASAALLVTSGMASPDTACAADKKNNPRYLESKFDYLSIRR